MVEPDGPHDNIMRRMRFACRITKATDTHSEYVILITNQLNTGFAKAPRFYGYTYIACLVFTKIALKSQSSKCMML